jgi:hypothetical protein
MAPYHVWMYDGTARTDVEIVVHEAAALFGTVLLGLLRAVDTVVEAWPLPGSGVKK